MRFFEAGATSLGLWLLLSGTSLAQIRPDRSLPNPSTVPGNCTDCEITGGSRAGNNLFHSFRQFSVPAGGRAYFNNATDVQNIFARVTGSSRSVIDGILQANGTANLFLLNPNGIQFGRHARLNLGGSFFASTADRISFADQEQFSAVQPQPLLTISLPVGLQFGPQPGAITSRSQLSVQPEQTLALLANGLELNRSSLVANSGSIELGSVAPFSTVSLTPRRTSFRVSYEPLRFNNPNLNSPDLNSQHTSQSTSQNFSDIDLTRSVITTSGLQDSPILSQRSGGRIQLQGRNIQITAGSTLYSDTYGGRGDSQILRASQLLRLNSAGVGTRMLARGRAGNIRVETGSLALQTGTDRSFLASQTLTGSTGNAGNLSIRAAEIALSDGSRLETATFGRGRGGDLLIQADRLAVSGFYPRISDFNGDGRPERLGQVPTGISAQAERSAGAAAGDAGSLTIHTDQLTLRAGGLISTATFAGGNGGDLNIRAAEIQLQGSSPAATRSQYRSGIFVSAEPNATGSVGALNLTAHRLTLEDRAQISARNRGAGQPGQATLRVSDLTVRGGSEISASTEGRGRGGRLTIEADSIQVSGSGQFQATLPSSLSALSTARASGQAGNLQIDTANLTVQNGAVVSVSGEGRGAAGNLTIAAEQIQLEQGRLEAATQAGRGAEITIQAGRQVLLQDESAISARAFNQADGGNITLQAPAGYLLAGANQNNDMIANAGQGAGGEITARLRGLLGLEERLSTPLNQTNDIDASSAAGAQGIVNIPQPTIDPSQGIIELPVNLVDAATLIAQTCPTNAAAASRLSEFVITGRGGLPPDPSAPRDDDALRTDWATAYSAAYSAKDQSAPSAQAPADSLNQSADLLAHRPTHPPLIEAQSWANIQGHVVLLGQAPASTQLSSLNPARNCPVIRPPRSDREPQGE